MKLLLASLLATLLSPPAHAGWMNTGIILEADTTDPDEISDNLEEFSLQLQALSAMSLVTPHKIVTTAIKGKITRYKWEDDAQCKYPNGGKPLFLDLSSSKTSYYYSDNPAKILAMFIMEIANSPCDLPPKPLKRVRKEVLQDG